MEHPLHLALGADRTGNSKKVKMSVAKQCRISQLHRMITAEPTPTPTIADLVVGDFVIFSSGVPIEATLPARIEKTTATQVIVRGERFPREQESRVFSIGRGRSFGRPSIKIPERGEIDRLIEENRRQSHVAKLQRTDWKKLPAAKVHEIVRIIESIDM